MVVGLAAAHAPPEEMPSHLRQRYTMDGSIAVDHLYVDEHTDGSAHYTFANHDIEAMLATARKMLNGSIPRLRQSQRHPTEAIRELQPTLIGAAAIVFGSTEPWAECLLLAAGVNNVTTVDYNYLASTIRRCSRRPSASSPRTHGTTWRSPFRPLTTTASDVTGIRCTRRATCWPCGPLVRPQTGRLAHSLAARRARSHRVESAPPIRPDTAASDARGWELVSRFGWADELLHSI